MLSPNRPLGLDEATKSLKDLEALANVEEPKLVDIEEVKTARAELLSLAESETRRRFGRSCNNSWWS